MLRGLSKVFRLQSQEVHSTLFFFNSKKKERMLSVIMFLLLGLINNLRFFNIKVINLIFHQLFSLKKPKFAVEIFLINDFSKSLTSQNLIQENLDVVRTQWLRTHDYLMEITL